VAALIYDKRGVGESTGSFAHATFDDLSDDAVAAADAAAAQPDIDSDRVGLLGFSQGGWVVAQAAQASDAVAFVAAYSPSGFSPGDQQAWLHGSMLTARGFGEAGMVVADRVSRMLYSSLDLVDAGIMPPIPHVPGFWFHSLDLHADSAGLWEGVRQPALLAWAATDCQVPAHDSMEALGGALRRGGNTDVTMAVLPEADHSFLIVEECGHETGLAHHASMQYADDYFDLGPDWVHTLGDTRRPAPDVPVADRPDTTVLGWHLDPPDPAPWYGTIPAQLAALIVLLGAFGLAAARWLAALVRRQATSRATRLGGIAGLAGVLAILIGFAAFTEVAMLGDTHAAPLVGAATVDGISPLMSLARLLVTLAAGLGAAAIAGVGRPRSSTHWVLAAGTALLIVWAAYWKLLPLT
jgi:hypothetical protein